MDQLGGDGLRAFAGELGVQRLVAQLVGVTDQADRRHLAILRRLDRLGDLGLVGRTDMGAAEVEQEPHRLRLVGAATARARADGLAEGGRGRKQGAGREQQADLVI